MLKLRHRHLDNIGKIIPERTKYVVIALAVKLNVVEDVEIEISRCAVAVVLYIILEHHHDVEGLDRGVVITAGDDQGDVLGHEGGLFGYAFFCIRNLVFPADQNAFPFLALRLGGDGNAVFDAIRERRRGGGYAHD